MIPLSPEETLLTGEWNIAEGKMVEDNVCVRIRELLRSHLKGIAIDKSGWGVLYQDPVDDRYWERVFPSSEMHGGGPPTLRNISLETAREKYGLE